MGEPQVAGVETRGLDGDVRLGDELLVALERPQRRPLAGLVAVEGEDHLAAELVVVEQEPAQHPAVVLAERGAAGRHGGGYAGQVAGHHVGVALDDDRLRAPGDLAPGQVDAVEHVALVVDRRLRRVEVLRLHPVVVEEPPGAEADDLAGEFADRPDQPAAEAVVASSAARGHQSAGDELLVGEAEAAQVGEQRRAGPRGEPDPERLGGVPVEPALGQEGPAGDRVGGGVEVLGIERRGRLVRLDQPRPAAVLLTLGPAAVDVPQGDAGLRGQPLDRVDESDPLDLLQERDDVAALGAAEAVEGLSCGRTLNDGDFSSWNGQSPFSDPAPAWRRVTYCETISSIRVRSRTRAMSSSRIRPAMFRSLRPGPDAARPGTRLCGPGSVSCP